FALLHGELSLMAGTIVLGLLAAWSVERSGSLWSAVVIHVLNNAVKVLAIYLALV
ncbi:MAG: CPBP family intramembrane metalloprotease, partial [Anaerolineales bacterium]|nr:CPBP family intramembrane metalloprotease [Anaerolineales bacterium]